MALRPEFELCRLGTFYFGSQFQGHTPDMLCAHMAEKNYLFPCQNKLCTSSQHGLVGTAPATNIFTTEQSEIKFIHL